MQRVLVTGAGGFIGGAIARHCMQLGLEVAGLGHGDCPEGLTSWIPGTVGPETLDRIGSAPDVIIHCAGGASVQASIENPERDRARTVSATDALVRWAARHAPGARIVYTSSGAVYGDAAAKPEGRGPGATPISPYGLNKAEAESCVLRGAAEDGLCAVVVRLFSVYGPGLRKQLLWDACCKMRTGSAEFFGTGREKRDFVEVTDVAKLLWLAAGAAGQNALVLDGGTGVGTSVRDIVAGLARHFDPEPEVRFKGEVRSGDPVDMIAAPGAAFDLGWRPAVGLDEGLRNYVKWFGTQSAETPMRA